MQQVINQGEVQVQPPVGMETPGQRLLAYYNAAIRLLNEAKEHTSKGDFVAQDETLGKVYMIISELNNALDFQQAPELCANLEQIYEFMGRQLIQANATMNTGPLNIVEQHLVMLKDAWVQVIPPVPVEA